MNTRSRILVAGAATGAALLLTATPAAAVFTENGVGCAGSATITDGAKTYEIDANASTAKAPRTGDIAWEGSVGTITHNHRGEVSIQIGPTKQKIDDWGPSANTGDQPSRRGTKEMPSFLEQVPGGKYKVSGFHQGDEGRCAGHVTIELEGGVFGSPLGIVAVVLAALGAAGVIGSMMASPTKPPFRGRPILGLFSGLLLGLFGSLSLLFAGVVSSDSILMVVLPPVLLVLGAAMGFMGPLGRGRVSAPAV